MEERALIEAMASGLPVVSTEVGGVADVVEHGVSGLLAPMDDAAGVADHILTLLAAPELRQAMGQRGRAKVAATYDAGRLVSDIETLYEDLIVEKQIDL